MKIFIYQENQFKFGHSETDIIMCTKGSNYSVKNEIFIHKCLEVGSYHNVFARDVKVGYQRFHGVKKLDPTGDVERESQGLILINHNAYNPCEKQ